MRQGQMRDTDERRLMMIGAVQSTNSIWFDLLWICCISNAVTYSCARNPQQVVRLVHRNWKLESIFTRCC